MNRKPSTRILREGILAALGEGPATAREIQARMGVSASNFGTHLDQLRYAGLIEVIDKLPTKTGSGRKPFLYALKTQARVA